ncbi:MAG: hypothetical protein H6736_09880 [Alphaproteobacteria bacterium]|nr:hypothetical protein [Alphaproteobacteria bacterium]MCB9692109.1 hypothetical protein [Alphaproteobacteria bacterium]
MSGRRWLWFVVPFTVVAAVAGAGAVLLWTVKGMPCDTYAPTEFFDLELGTRCVRVQGMAHYDVVVTQKVAGNGFFADKTYYVYGLFPAGNTDEREIRVLVRTEREPERLVSFETMTIEGRLLPMDYRKVPFDTERRMGQKSNYFFSDRIKLLEPDRIEVEGEAPWVREAPAAPAE